MKKLNEVNLRKVSLSYDIMSRFSISVFKSQTSLSKVDMNLNKPELAYTDTEDLSCNETFFVYDKEINKRAFTLKSNKDSSDVIPKIKELIIRHLNDLYTKSGYIGILVDVMVIQADGCYHIEPNTIIFIKNKYIGKDMVKIVYTPDNKIFAETESDEAIEISKDDFVDIGILD